MELNPQSAENARLQPTPARGFNFFEHFQLTTPAGPGSEFLHNSICCILELVGSQIWQQRCDRCQTTCRIRIVCLGAFASCLAFCWASLAFPSLGGSFTVLLLVFATLVVVVVADLGITGFCYDTFPSVSSSSGSSPH